MIRRFVALCLCLMLLTAALPVLAEDVVMINGVECITTEDGEFPELNEDGFLDAGEFLYQNPEAGIWRYCSQTLKVEIIRYQITEPANDKAIWYEAEVWSTEEDVWQLFTYQEGKHMSSNARPHLIAQKNQVVLSITGDYAHARYQNKKTTGIVIRDGKVFSDKTLKKGTKQFPNLDVLALFPDGRMEVFYSNEHTAQEYLDMGVTSTLAFGPVMIRDGVLDEEALNKYGTSTRAPRAAIGMVEKGHYFAMMLEGRHKGSKGGIVRFLGEKMFERGCTLAFNLDGGETCAIMFMGQQICTVGQANNKGGYARHQPSVLGIGVSGLVVQEEE